MTYQHPDFPRLKAKELSQEEIAQKRVRAFELEVAIKLGIAETHRAFWKLAEALYEFDEELGWRWLNYDTLQEFLAQPEIGITRRSYFRLVQVHRDLVVSRRVPTSALEEIDPTKVYEVLPAILRGDVAVDEALSDAKVLGARDIREKYRKPGKIEKKLDASEEPARVRCPACDQWTTEDQLSKAIDGTARRRS